MRDPYSNQLTEPGLMDQSENPFGGLFKPSNLQSIGSASDPSVSAKPAQSDDESLSESIRKMMELNNQYYHPEHTASDRLNQLLNSFPQEKRPSIGRTIVAGLAGMGAKEGGGYDASQKVIDEPFKGDLEKWKAQTQPSYQAAEAENQGNVNQRTLLGNMITAETASRRNRTADDKYRAEILSREKIATEKDATTREIAQSKQRLEQYKFDNPYLIFDFNSPTVQAFDQQTGESFDTKVPSGHISDMDKAAINQKNKLAQIAAQGDQSRRNEGTRQENRIVIEDKRAQDARDLKGVENESQQRIGEARRAKSILNQNPELRPYIKFDGSSPNDFTLTPPKAGFFSGVSADIQKKYDDAVKQIYGQQPTIGGPPTSTQKPKPIAGSNQGIPSNQGVPATTTKAGDYTENTVDEPIIQQNRTTGAKRVSYDGGKTWKPYTGGQ
jgi:hypothetical protein